VRAITAIAIVVAAVAAIIGGTLLLFTPVTIATEPTNEQQEIIAAGANLSSSGYRQVNVTLSNVTLVADIAETNEQRTKGLSVKDTLDENEGMLFLFKTPSKHSFWMKNMKFPIDIIWISEYHEVVHVEHSLEPCKPHSFCPTYKPDRDALYVLETVAGFAQKYNVTENDYVDFQLEEE
jgi:uncharacterized membrane protein (UPF0127 family)